MGQDRTIEPAPRPGQTDLAWYEWLIIAAVCVGGLLLCAFGGRSLLAGFASPTATPTVFARPTFTPAPTDTPTPTPTPTPVPPPTTIAVGGFVRVVEGVNFRTEASTQGQLIRSLADGVVLEVVGGPTEADGLTWWQLRDVDGSIGWAAAQYLVPAPPPAP
ncbi:MAG TPA: SH3 domain-containing protein [Anaerolineae bacterium]|nr:SH3 domain-containing protein [Anaerolineae bacterium]